MSKRRAIRPPRSLLHIGELVAQRGNSAVSEPICNGRHERVRHPGPCAMRHDIAGYGLLWDLQQARDGVGVVHVELHGAGLRHVGRSGIISGMTA